MNSVDKEITLLNKNIIKNEKKIKNLRIRDDIIGFFPVAILTGTTIGVGIKFNNSQFISDHYFGMILISLFTGCIPANFLPFKKTIKKVKVYQKNIQDDINKLHSIALEENKKYSWFYVIILKKGG